MGVFFYFKGLVNYNGGMDKKDYYTNCEKCGRPQTYAKPCSCGCPFGTGEYKINVKGCIRNKNPECPYNAVIASVTVETMDGIKNLADCFVHVTSNNTTFYIDDKHRIMTIWAGPVETTMPEDVQTDAEMLAFIKSFNLRSQFLYIKYFSNDDQKNKIISFYCDKTGAVYYDNEFEELVGQGE